MVPLGCFAQAHKVRHHELAVGVDAAPCPGVTGSLLAFFPALLFAADEGPKLIDLDALALQIPHKLVMQIGTENPHVRQQPQHSQLGLAADTGGAVDAVTLRETPEDRRSFGYT